ncbi:Excitatory amino acid transporter 3 [Mactra antiquata]
MDKTKVWTFLRKNILLIFLVLALGIGIGLGAELRTLDPPMSTRSIMYLRFPGDILMNMLSFLIVPLIISSLVSGLASLDSTASGKMGLRAVIYYLTTTFAAVVLGIVLTVSIQPGRQGDSDESNNDTENENKVVNTADTFLDLIRQCFPANIMEMCFRKTVTEQVLRGEEPSTEDGSYTSPASMTTTTYTISSKNSSHKDKVYDPVLTKIDGPNVLGMVVFSILLGVILSKMEERGKPLIVVFETICEATMQLVKLAIWYSPIGIMCLIAANVVDMDDPAKTFQQLLYYFLTVMAGLFIHGVVTLPLIYFLFVRQNPFSYLYGVFEAIVTAIATASSSATMPVTMRCLVDNNGVDNRVVKFVIPVGATINMDGTALYEAVAVLFIGQMRGYEMDIGRIITISITATAAAIGAAGVPQAGLVTMVIVLSAVGFPTDDVALILAVDWLLDRFRTAVNVLGDAFGAGIVNHLSRRELKDIDNKHNMVFETEIDNTRCVDSDNDDRDDDVNADDDDEKRLLIDPKKNRSTCKTYTLEAHNGVMNDIS